MNTFYSIMLCIFIFIIGTITGIITGELTHQDVYWSSKSLLDVNDTGGHGWGNEFKVLGLQPLEAKYLYLEKKVCFLNR